MRGESLLGPSACRMATTWKGTLTELGAKLNRVQNGDPMDGDPRAQYANEWRTGSVWGGSRNLEISNSRIFGDSLLHDGHESSRMLHGPRSSTHTHTHSLSLSRSLSLALSLSLSLDLSLFNCCFCKNKSKESNLSCMYNTQSLKLTHSHALSLSPPHTGMFSAPCANPLCFCGAMVCKYVCVYICMCVHMCMHVFCGARVCIRVCV